MGKQSARIYYRETDHKDIYFQGNYHNAMIVSKESDSELVWRKLYDEGYFVYTRWDTDISRSYYTAILYPKYRIREYRSEIAMETYHSDKYLARKYAYVSTGAIVSADGKLWRRIDGNDEERGVIPKCDGIVVCSNIAALQCKYTYIPILESGYLDEKNSFVIFSDDAAGTRTDNSFFYSAGISDVCLLMDNSKSPVEAFAVDMKGNIYDGLFTTYYSEISSTGCYNGLYYCTISNVPDGCYVFVSNSINVTWKRLEFPVKARYVQTIESSDGVVIYMSWLKNSPYGAVQVYVTTDFVNYTKIDIPDSIVVPIIGQIYAGEKSYLNLKMSYYAADLTDAYNIDVNSNTYQLLSEMSRCQICYIEKGKIAPPKGMIIHLFIRLINTQEKQITAYLDNMFFQESDGNFAFFEGLYPESYMNDYLGVGQ